jgi:hypothetical protein
MLPTTALTMLETYFGHRLLSVRRRTLNVNSGDFILCPHLKNYGAAPVPLPPPLWQSANEERCYLFDLHSTENLRT